MAPNLLFAPIPRQLTYGSGELSIVDNQLIILNSPRPQELRFSANRLQQVLLDRVGASWTLTAATTAPTARIGLRLHLVPDATRQAQSYKLTISAAGIDIIAAGAAGIHYGILTLIQLIEQRGSRLPHLHIEDWPDFPVRGVMLDISHDRVPTMETLFDLVDLLASWKINQIQLYTEHTFAYQNHPEVWTEASPMTGEEMLALDVYCSERFIDLVPNQNTFGHMYRWLRHERYLPLAEVVDGAQTPWGFYWEGPYSLSPSEPGSMELIRDMLGELLPHFSSQLINVGCDETFDVGEGKSKEMVAEQGVGRVYLDFLLKIYREVKARGRTMQYWGDIIVEYPELVPELPGDAIAMEWGYEAGHPFDEHGALFAAAGVPFNVCPGTSSWRSLAGRTDNALQNLGDAARYGLKHGATGYLITDWGDKGHWQPLPSSYLGFIAGAALAWSTESNEELPVRQALDLFAYKDRANVMGALSYDLGNVYQMPGVLPENSSVLFNALRLSGAEIQEQILQHTDITALRPRLDTTIVQIDEILSTVPQANMQRADADLIQREFLWVAAMLQHGCRRLIWVIDGQPEDDKASMDGETITLIEEFEQLWIARSRTGGFVDSVARMQKMRNDYQTSAEVGS